MAKNFIQDGNVLPLIAPVGGVLSGGIYAIGTLVVIANGDAAEGETFQGHASGVWSVPADTGLAAGATVGLLAGELVAAATAEAVACGKLVTAESGGYASVRLSN
ncbi:Predicted phage recombinase, RecA/RadA family [Pseudomonas linyingensis]|uniref:Predicted phage recombinase, RecA/RadA family n=1 Tax=Pseudomonas linyingensis TaxID=915471 RepID=A0A1H6ZX36_9PSED|nr:capsid cement protein [Pseudomonas linyingensis]SEJ57901.1 Predicted phage recombinase, RecA/RadA family [Pseudomonas linyingensis]